MFYSDRFYNEIVNSIQKSSTRDKAEKIKYVESVRALDKEGPESHAAYIKQTRYDVRGRENRLYYPTEMYGEQSKSVPMHIEYWAPKPTKNRDDGMMQFMTLEQYLEKEIRDFGEAWSLAKEKNKTKDFITSEMNGGCYEACARGIQNFKSKLMADSHDFLGSDEDAIYKVIEHYRTEYAKAFGAFQSNFDNLPENLQFVEPFIEWLMKQEFTINGSDPKHLKNEIKSTLIEIFSLDSKENALFSATEKQPIKLMNSGSDLDKNKAKTSDIERAEVEKVIAKLKISTKYSEMDISHLNSTYKLFLRQQLQPKEALQKAILFIEKSRGQLIKNEEPSDNSAKVGASAKQEIDSTLRKTNDPDLQMLPVLDQVKDETGFGQESCGYHAVKNALAIQYCAKANENPTDWVTDQGFFNNVFQKLAALNDSENKDVGIVPIKSFINAANLGQYTDDPTFNKVSKIFDNDNEIPLMSVGAFATSGNNYFFANSGSFNLEDAANLYYIATHPEQALTHTFIIGDQEEGHWVTLTLQQNPPNQKKWIGTNSNADEKEILIRVKNGFEKLMNQPEQYSTNIYQSTIGANFNRMAHQTSNAEEKNNLLSIEETTFAEVTDALNFMRRCEWFNPTKINSHIGEIVKLEKIIDFYSLHSTSKNKWNLLKADLDKVVPKDVKQSKNRVHPLANQRQLTQDKVGSVQETLPIYQPPSKAKTGGRVSSLKAMFETNTPTISVNSKKTPKK